jgi:hypothetical protein
MKLKQAKRGIDAPLVLRLDFYKYQEKQELCLNVTYVYWSLCYKTAISVTANVTAVPRSKKNCEDIQKEIFDRRAIKDFSHIPKYRLT